MTDAEIKALMHKKIMRNEKAIKRLREQLRIAVNIIRVKARTDNGCLVLVDEMKKCLDDTIYYWRGERLTNHDRSLYGLPAKKGDETT